MFITKKSLSRRTILRGIGAGVALPLLDSMAPAFAAPASPVRRFGAIFVPLGERPGYWTPAKTGADFEFTPILKPLRAVPQLAHRCIRTLRSARWPRGHRSGLAERQHPEENHRRGCPGRHHHRSDRGQKNRPGHRLSLA